MKKKLFSLIICGALAIANISCGSSGTAPSGETTDKPEEAAEEMAETDLTGKLAALDVDTSGITSFKEVSTLGEVSEEDSRANEALPSLLKVNDSSTEVEASLQSNMQVLSYGGVIFQVPAAWQWATTQEGYLATYPQDGHCYIIVNGTGVRGYDSASIMNKITEGLTAQGETVSECSAGGKNGLKAEYYSTSNGGSVKVTDYYFLPNDTWLMQMQCVSTTTESFDSVMQTLDFTHSVMN